MVHWLVVVMAVDWVDWMVVLKADQKVVVWVENSVVYLVDLWVDE